MSKYRINRRPVNSSMITKVHYHGRDYYNPKFKPVIRSNVATSRNAVPVKWTNYRYLGAKPVSIENNRYNRRFETADYVSYYGMPKVSVVNSAIALFLFLLIYVSAVRLSNNMEAISAENLLNFLSRFEDFSNVLRHIEIPTIPISTSTNLLVQFLGSTANKLIGLINSFWGLGLLLWRVIYVCVKVIIWAITGLSV